MTIPDEKRPSMAREREARAYHSGNEDGIDAANADAPTPESNAGDVLDRAWAAAEDEAGLESQTEREEYFVGWTHGYVNRAEGIEEDQEDSIAETLPEQRMDPRVQHAPTELPHH